jgi:predicted homoserine dehydrogenase-like protein
MRGPSARDVQESLHLFDLERIWKSGQPIVDYILGAQPGGGVFVIGRSDDRYTQEMMSYYKMGQGPFYLFYRPYHLCHIESMRSIVEAAREGKSLLEPKFGFRTNVACYAKQNLKEGGLLDGVGGYMSYGMIENFEDPMENPGLPICLSDGARLLRDVAIDEKICINDVWIDPNRDDFKLFQYAMRAHEDRNRCRLSLQ